MKTSIACALLLLAGVLAAPSTVHAAIRRQDINPAPLELKKAEIRKLSAETAKLESDEEWWARLLPIVAPLLTALAAGTAVIVSVWKVGRDRRDAIKKETSEREAARQAAEIERFDERFAKAVSGLSSSKPGEQIGAAILVTSMVREKSEDLSNQALQLLLVALQAPHDPACERLLRFALERFARAAPRRLVDSDEELSVGLAHTRASHLNLAHLDLPKLDIAFSSLRKADFRGANLRGCRAYQANVEEAVFDKARLEKVEWVNARAMGARFRYADLSRGQFRRACFREANFYSANLERAKFRKATLIAAGFEEALLSRADFHGAEFDDVALRSILRARDWRSAEFSEDTRVRLESLENDERRAL